MYLPGTDTPVQVVLSLPESSTTTAGVTDNSGKQLATSYTTAIPTISIPSAGSADPASSSVVAVAKQPSLQVSSPHSIELCIPSPKMSKENKDMDGSMEMVVPCNNDGALSR